MNIWLLNFHSSGYGKTERGMAVLVVLILLAIMSVLVVANTRTVLHLKQEIRLIEKQQLKKFEPAAPPKDRKPRQKSAAAKNDRR